MLISVIAKLVLLDSPRAAIKIEVKEHEELFIKQDEALYPSISNDYVAWGESLLGVQGVKILNISEKNQKVYVERLGHSAINPIISGNKMVWLNPLDGYSLNLTELTTRRSSLLAEGMVIQPSISGSLAVWLDYSDGFKKIIYYNFQTGIKKQLTQAGSNPWQPVTNGKQIAWIDERAGYAKVFLYDTETDLVMCLSSSGHIARDPWLSTKCAVWSEYHDKGSVIKLCNLQTNDVKTLTSSNKISRCPRISDSLVAWEDWTDTGPEVIVMTIEGEKIVTKSDTVVSSWAPTICNANVAMLAIFNDGSSGVYAMCNIIEP